MKTLHYIKRALSLPPHIVLKKIVHKLKKDYAARKKKYLDERFPTYSQNYPHAYLNSFIHKINSPLPEIGIRQLNEYYLNHEFDLLGSGWVRVSSGMKCKGIEEFQYPPSGKGGVNDKNLIESNRIYNLIRTPYLPIDWQLDFKSGYRWNEDTWSLNIKYGADMGADVKVPWELSRMQHLPSLAWGYALENKAIYISEFQNQILDFISSNPPRYGVNWVCTMDVGIRIANWLISYDLFSAYGAKFDSEFMEVFIRSVYEHGHHIFNHLEWDPHLRSNHYLANIAGLLFVSSYLPSSPETDSWFGFSVQELINEVLSQFNQDGSNFEASTCYHRLSAEMVVYATALALENEVKFPEEYLNRIQKMGDFIRDITKPDGQIVQIGDNDSGRFIKLFPDSHMLDHRYLIPPIRNLKNLTSVIESQLSSFSEEARALSSYPNFGLFIQNANPWFLAVRCGSIGQNGNGGHAHNDQLSFELAVNGISMIVDPGTYVYTPIPKARRLFRSTAMHNTLTVEGKEQNGDDGLFKMSDKAKAKFIRFEDGVFVGEQSGFGPVHRRTLNLSDNFLEGIDEYEGGPRQIYFHFAPEWKGIQISEKMTEWTLGAVKVRISSDQGIWRLTDGEYSSAYGERMTAPVLVLIADSKPAKWKISAV